MRREWPGGSARESIMIHHRASRPLAWIKTSGHCSRAESRQLGPPCPRKMWAWLVKNYAAKSILGPPLKNSINRRDDLASAALHSGAAYSCNRDYYSASCFRTGLEFTFHLVSYSRPPISECVIARLRVLGFCGFRESTLAVFRLSSWWNNVVSFRGRVNSRDERMGTCLKKQSFTNKYYFAMEDCCTLFKILGYVFVRTSIEEKFTETNKVYVYI